MTAPLGGAGAPDDTEGLRSGELSRPWSIAVVALPVAVSLGFSATWIVRSARTLNGQRAYLLFDDAAISLRYARNLATGHGLTFNPGRHPVEGYSNFLWTLWMAALEVGHPADRMAGLGVMVSSGFVLAANVWIVVLIARRLAPNSRIVPLAAGLLTALYYGLVSWSLEGMETGLVALLSSAAVLCALRACDTQTSKHNGDLVGCGVLLALALLTRDDALIIAVVVIAFLAVRSGAAKKALLLSGGPVVLALAGHLAFRLVYYGLPLPNTYYLKLQGIPLTTRSVRGLLVLAENATVELVVPLVLAIAFLWLSHRAGRRPPTGTGLLASIIAAQALYVVYVGGDAYAASRIDRTLVPVVPFLMILAALGAVALARSARSSPWPLVVLGSLILASGVFTLGAVLPLGRLGVAGSAAWRPSAWPVVVMVAGLAVVVLGLPIVRRLPRAVTVGTLVVVAVLAANAVFLRDWYRSNSNYSSLEVLVSHLGVTLRQATPPDATIAVNGAGNAPFFDHRNTVDLLGYTDHVVATSKPHDFVSQPGHDKWDYSYSIGRLHPDVVIGLVYPTRRDVQNMKRWGYREVESPYFGTVYYLPSWLHAEDFGAPAP